MLTQEKIDSLYSIFMHCDLATTSFLSDIGFSRYDLERLVKSGYLSRAKKGYYCLNLDNDEVCTKMFLKKIENKDYDDIFKYFKGMDKSLDLGKKQDNNLWLFLLSQIIEIPSEYRERLFKFEFGDVCNIANDLDSIEQYSKVRFLAFNHKFALARKCCLNINDTSDSMKILQSLLDNIYEARIDRNNYWLNYVIDKRYERLVSEIEKIAKEGIKEVVITGIHVASYGKDFDNENTSKKIRLIDLLEAINKIDGIDRIRLSSLEPTIVDEEFATRLSKLDKICDHFHLSLQSGCDETLKRMNRKYTTQIYRDAVATLRKYYPEASFTTDVIVGFPGETDEEFAKTYEFLKEIDFYRLHVFKYSPRRGTVAEKMPNQIDGNKKEERSNKLIELSNSTENKHNKNYIGKTVKVLFEEFENGFFKGHTTNYMMVKVAGEEEQSDKFVNKILDVKIKENNDETRELIGILS